MIAFKSSFFGRSEMISIIRITKEVHVSENVGLMFVLLKILTKTLLYFLELGALFYLVAIASTFLHPLSPPFRSSSLRPICFSLYLIMIISFLLGGAFVYVLS